MTADTLPTDTLRELPGGGLVARSSTRREERDSTKEERELLLLLDYAASKLGDEVLGATDLDDRLDALLDDPDVFHWNALVRRGRRCRDDADERRGSARGDRDALNDLPSAARSRNERDALARPSLQSSRRA